MPRRIPCLSCRLVLIDPEAVAGLCDSCRAHVRQGTAKPVITAYGALLPEEQWVIEWQMVPTDPPGEGPDVAYTQFNVEPHYPPREAAKVREELLSLVATRPRNKMKRAIEVVQEIRDLDCDVYYSHCCANLSHPRRVPYVLLCEYVALQPYVVDVLTHEESEIRSDEDRLRRESDRADKPEPSPETVLGTQDTQLDSPVPERSPGRALGEGGEAA